MQSLSNSKPLVSIGLPVFNEEPYLRLSLEALLAQDYQNLELIISDNASTDRTGEICKEFRDRDNRVKYLRRGTNVGAFDNFNGLFELARGKYFMWAGAHDLWAPGFVSRAVSVLESNPDVVLVHPHTMQIDREGNSLGVMADEVDTRGRPPLERYLNLIWNLQSCNMIHGLIRTEALAQAGLLSRVWGSDVLLLAKLSLRGEFEQIPEVLFYRREIRPQERDDLDAWKKRALVTVEGTESKRSSMSLEELFREMRNAELKLIFNSQLSLGDKMTALVQTIKCSRRRYGVRLPADLVLRGLTALRSPQVFLSRLRSRLHRA